MKTMSGSDSGTPTPLRDRVVADLQPVRPLAEPWRRALLLAPVGLVLLAAVHARYGTRGDVGAVLLWGLSLLQIAVGVAIVSAALREVVPGRGLSVPVQVALFAAGLGLAVAVTYVAWHASGTIAPAHLRYRFWKSCFRGTIEVGLPALLAIMLLAARGVMWRPALVGGLAGLAAGLIADASWRTFCDVSEPAHVLSAHVAGIVALAAIGAVGGKLYARLARVR
jgi:hypothetical protein